LLQNKDASGFLKPFSGRTATVHTVPVPNHPYHDPAQLTAAARANGLTAFAASDPLTALDWIVHHADRTQPPVVLIGGSLYLAGEMLAANGTPPD
jgi:dihydrofolate synthase/folylpolyglutamate synthase